MGLAFPGLLLALVPGLAPGQGGVWALVTAPCPHRLGLVGPRLARGLLKDAQGREFRFLGGRAPGSGVGWRLLGSYLLPQMWPPLAVAAAMKTGWIIVALFRPGVSGPGHTAASSGVGEPCCNSPRLYMSRAPWLMLAPGGGGVFWWCWPAT